jgi:hypothetical protein
MSEDTSDRTNADIFQTSPAFKQGRGVSSEVAGQKSGSASCPRQGRLDSTPQPAPGETPSPVRAPSGRGIEGVLQWIQEAETVNQRWARNTLGVFVAFVLLVILAIRLGWLPR